MKIRLIFLFLSVGSVAKAQLPVYFIDLYMGDVQMIKPGKKPIPVKTHMLVFPDDKILIKKDGAQITLVNKEQQSIVLVKKGNYKIAELSNIPRKKSSGITQKYFYMVWEELLDPARSTNTTSFNNIAGSFGGVSRGACDFSGIPFNNTVTADPIVNFTCAPMDSTKQYRFSIFDDNNKVLLQLIIRDTMCRLSNKNFLPEKENIYYWYFESVENSCDETPKNKLVWLTSDEYARRAQELVRSVKAVSNTHYNLEICKVLANNGFYDLALEYFKKAIEKD